MTPIQALFFRGIVLSYLGLGLTYALVTPPWQAPDEPAHYNYIRAIVAQGQLPVLELGCYDQDYLARLTSEKFPAHLPVDSLCYEAHQPPLYYLVQTPIFWLTDGSLTALRLISVLLGGGVVVLAFFVAYTIFPQQIPIALGTMALVAWVPMHLAIVSSVNNDALAYLIIGGILLLLTRMLRHNESRDLLLALLLGLGLLTKLTVYVTIPVIALALWMHSASYRALAMRLSVVYGVAVLIALPWYLRNGWVYGGFDILGMARHDAVVIGQLRTADHIAAVGFGEYLSQFVLTTFRSFWGQFGWMAVPMDGRTYFLLLCLVLCAGLGLIVWLRHWRSCDASQRQALTVMILFTGLMVLAYIGYNLSFVQFQGRYLFPALIPLALLLALGLLEAGNHRAWLVAGVIIAVGARTLITSNVDSWVVLLAGAFVGVTVAQFYDRWRLSASWLLLVACGGVGLLAGLSPVWFIRPFL